MDLFDLLWVFAIISTPRPIVRQCWLEAQRLRAFRRLAEHRHGRVIGLTRREEHMSILGFPMGEHAVLGPVDPKLGQYPAASLLKVMDRKPVAEIDDQTIFLGDVARKAICQVEQFVREPLSE